MSIFEILSHYRSNYKSEREKGTYFENLIEVFLKNDERFSDQFTSVVTYAKWAESQGVDAKDIGIDLVAINKDNTLSAIQCKIILLVSLILIVSSLLLTQTYSLEEY